MSFTSLKLPVPLSKGIEKDHYKKPYPIQEKAIPAIIDGNDVLAIAKTGSGKTASYVLPILVKEADRKTTRNRFVTSLILVPTRELANQVLEVFLQFSPYLNHPPKAMAVFGGASINPQMKKMIGTQILIATPGRLIELADKNAVHLDDVKTLVLDEADKMLNMGFRKELDQILTLLPKRRQNLLFSATLSNDIKSMDRLILSNPITIKIEEKEATVDLIKQSAYKVTEERKGPFLRYLIKHLELKQVMVFTSSIHKADSVAEKLNKNGIHAKAIHGKKSQFARIEGLKNFKSGKLPVLVTTDLLSRGIDIEFLPHVINYELPRSPKDFIHRIGRTGRAENPGEAISLITEKEDHHFQVIMKKMKRSIELQETESINLHGY
ncbi:DEAD/DEAH box helicase [Fulvivirga lutimaris]|uniref:DEAD/DEAH box helicase n=1 Tax=Fulvivirga lutimaris TaxID=1819566 RepID=UPI0012BD2F01|nr:DEAD/DEAH box helicase [Fulvivirga lutimaris]MTI41838.1 DEAD/DEAH box helicase [Fulvivirga lutimaris]